MQSEHVHEWESRGQKFRSVKIGTHWYSIPIGKAKEPVHVGDVVQWLVSGRWRCSCGRRHRPYVPHCQCGERRPRMALNAKRDQV